MVEIYGIKWLEEQFKLCREGYQQDLLYLAMLIPLARTPMDKKSANAMKGMIKDVQRTIDRITNWEDPLRKHEEKKRRYAKMGIKPGEVVVLSEGAPVDNIPVFKDAKIVKGK